MMLIAISVFNHIRFGSYEACIINLRADLSSNYANFQCGLSISWGSERASDGEGTHVYLQMWVITVSITSDKKRVLKWEGATTRISHHAHAILEQRWETMA